MRNIWLLIALIIVIGCTNDSQDPSNLLKLVPQDTAVILKTSSIEGLRNVIKNNGLLSQFAGNAINDLDSKVDYLKYLKPIEDLLVTIGTYDSDSIQVAVITKYHKNLFNLDSLPNRTIQTLISNGISLTQSTIDNRVVFSAIKDSIFIASTNQDLVEAAYNQKKPDINIKDIFLTSHTEQSLSIFINTKDPKFKPQLFLDEDMNNLQFANHLLLDAELTQDYLKFDGITKAVDSSKSWINIFKNTIPQENKIATVCPPDIDAFLSISFNDFINFRENLFQYQKKDSIAIPSALENILEAGIIYKNTHEAIFLNTVDADAMNEFFRTQNPIETYRDIDIYTYDQPELFSTLFSPLINYKKASNYIFIDNYFVFSEDTEFLKEFISSYQNNATLYTSRPFEDLMEQLSDESSVFVYANSQRLKSIINSNFGLKTPIESSEFNTSAIQFVYEKDFAHVHARIQKDKKRSVSNTVEEDLNITLDADIINSPQFVNNNTNNQMEVVVQDINNNLYLISKEGKVLWKKQLESKILGRIEQIDASKNGNLQLVFATQHRVYLLDRNGKDVGVFPLKFNDRITQPLSVFDYEKKRDYRLMVTQGSHVLMYTSHGKTVIGFNYKKAENTINTQPEHFKIGTKDYIVFVQGNELEILSRVGKTRVHIKNNITFSDSGIFIYDNKFTTTSANGDLVQIDENGKMYSNALNLGEKHAIAATSKTLVTLSENILHIKSHRIELDFGEYTPPKIFYVNDKIYVSVTDLQAKKVYLFDSLGKSIPGFPVYGNSSIDLNNIDKEKNPELVTKGGLNSIIVYQIN